MAIAETERERVEKIIEEIWESKGECFSTVAQCCEKLKNMFITIGAFSSETKFTRGDIVGAMKWIEGEVEAFDEVLTDHNNFYACVGARGIVLLFKKARCHHVKTIVEPEFNMFVYDIKEPSTKAIKDGRRFYSKIWHEGGRKAANDIMRDNTDS